MSPGLRVPPIFGPRDPRVAGPAGWPGRITTALTAACFVLLAWHFGWSWQLPAYLFFAGVGVRLSVIDLRHRLLPNAIVLPGFGLGAVLLTGASAAGNAWGPLVRAGEGSLALFGVYLALALVSPAGMGMGDVKLAAVVGLFLAYQGWQTLAVGTFAGFLIGALASAAVLARRRGGLKSTIPFGPPMIAGALAAILLAGPAAGF
jgi:leader peptidase (prepilin peptidase)/N-methyltransferase